MLFPAINAFVTDIIVLFLSCHAAVRTQGYDINDGDNLFQMKPYF